MNKLIMLLCFIIFVFLLMILLHVVLIRSSKYPIHKRYLHSRYLLVSLVLLIILNNYTFAYLLGPVNKFINHPQLQNFWNVVLPMRRLEQVFLLLSLLLTNLLFIFIIGIIFWIVRTIFSRKDEYQCYRSEPFTKKILHLNWVLADCFYTEDEEMRKDNEQFHLTDQGFTIGLWAKRMKYVFILWGIAEILMLTYSIFSDNEYLLDNLSSIIEGFYLLPAAGYLFLEQIQFFLEDDIEYDEGSFGTSTIDFVLTGNLKAIMHQYEQEYISTSALINYGGWENYHLLQDGLAHNAVTNEQVEQCEQPEILLTLSNQLRAAEVTQNLSYQNAIISLLNGLSVNIRDYIQGEVLIYLAAYFNYFLSQGKTFLILCKSRMRAEQIRVALEEAMNRINKIYALWKISDIDDADSNEKLHVLVCSYQDLVNHRLVDKRKDFCKSLHTVVLTDGMDFCAQGNAQKELIFAEIGKVTHKLLYVLVTQNDNDSMRTAFEYYTGEELYPYNNDMVPKNVYFMIWKEESSCRLQQAIHIGQDLSPYLGVSIPLALTAIKYDSPYVTIFANRRKGFNTYHDSATMSRQALSEYVFSEVNLNQMIRYNKFDVMDRENLEIQILYDSEFNFYNLIWSHMKYGGGEKTLIHVVSPPYMLREYLADQIYENTKENNDFDALITYQSGLDHTRFLSILLELCNAGLTEEELMKKSAEYYWPYNNVIELLTACLKGVLSEAEFNNVYECFHFEERSFYNSSEDCFERSTYVTLTDENIRRRIQSRLVFAKLRTKDNREEELSILSDNVYNYYAQEQIVPINNYMYKINSINEGLITAEQFSVKEKLDYYRSVEVVIKNLVVTDECLDFDKLDVNIGTADVTMTFHGYWYSKSGIDFHNPRSMRFQFDNRQEKHPQTKRKVRVMEMRLKRSALGPDPDKAGFLAAFMFQELAKNAFPYNFMNLYVVHEYMAEEKYWDYLKEDSTLCSLDEKVNSILPFVRVDQCDPDYYKIYFIEFSSLEMGIISSLYSNRMYLFEMAYTYLEWYMEGQAYEKEADEDNLDDEQEDEGTEDRDGKEDGDEGDNSDKTEENDEQGEGPQWIIEIDDDPVYSKPEHHGNSNDNISRPAYLNLGGKKIASCFNVDGFFAYCQYLLPPNEKTKGVGTSRISYDDLDCCSFCGRLSVLSYHMSDGRIMCRGCHSTRTDQRSEINQMYFETVRALQEGYNIKLRGNIHLRMQSANAIRIECSKGRATPIQGRVLGFYRPRTHELWIESQGPRNAVRATMIHELSHSWQFDNMDVQKLQKLDPTLALILLEGHTSFMEVDAMIRLGEEEYAKHVHEELMRRNDEYGIGYKLLRNYIKRREEEGSHITPYTCVKYLFDNLDELQELLSEYKKNLLD